MKTRYARINCSGTVKEPFTRQARLKRCYLVNALSHSSQERSLPRISEGSRHAINPWSTWSRIRHCEWELRPDVSMGMAMIAQYSWRAHAHSSS